MNILFLLECSSSWATAEKKKAFCTLTRIRQSKTTQLPNWRCSWWTRCAKWARTFRYVYAFAMSTLLLFLLQVYDADTVTPFFVLHLTRIHDISECRIVVGSRCSPISGFIYRHPTWRWRSGHDTYSDRYTSGVYNPRLPVVSNCRCVLLPLSSGLAV